MDSTKINRFTGINNRQPIDRIKPTDAGMPVRDALNVDLSDVGTLQRRPGTTKKLSGTNVRDLFQIQGGALFADGDRLKLFNGSSASEVATLTTPHARVSYVQTPLGVVWSDGYRLNVYKGTSKRLAPATPNPEPFAVAASGGALTAGTYGVMFTSIRSDGQQSAPTIPVYVSVPQGGIIQVTASGHADRIAVFITAPDGEVFYREGSIEVGQSSAIFPLVRGEGQPVAFEVTADLPAGAILALHKGRLLSAVGPYLYFSQPWNMGLYRPATDFIPMAEDITLVAPVEGGVYLATLAETWWLPGGDITKADAIRLHPYGAVRGTLARLDDSNDLMWFTPKGPVRASQDGQIQALQEDAVVFPSADAGASIWRESNGLRQLISAISTNPSIPPGAAVAGSYMDAEVIQP